MPNVSKEIEYDRCPICASGIKNWRVKNAAPNRYEIAICTSCSYAFVNPRPSLPFLMNYYATSGHRNGQMGQEACDYKRVIEQERDDPNSSKDAARVIKTIKSLTKNRKGRFLDVGCGYGFFSREALDAGFEVIALELAENERRIAGELTGLKPVGCSFEAFEGTPASLSVVLMSQILEHALDVNFWVEKAHTLLADQGVIAILLPNFGSIFRRILQEKEPYICPPAHLNFFSVGSLSKLLEKHGFTVNAVQWISRIPKRSYEKRLPRSAMAFLPVVKTVSSTLLKAIDALRLGMIINVYARKSK